MTGERDREMETLRLENQALNEQIKLLVQTEQRLYRSQNELDSQLTRVRALAKFALQSSRDESPGHILSRALEVVWTGFALDWVGVVGLDASLGTLQILRVYEGSATGRDRVAADEALTEWLRELREPVFVPDVHAGSEDPPHRLSRLFIGAAAAPGEPPSFGQFSCTPLRRVDERHGGVLVTYSFHRRVAAQSHGALTEQHLPFLQLLANHVDHAIANALLTDDLRERSEELARSLETLGRTQQDLLQAQKMEAVGRLAGGVAHDFNNLLTVILGYAGSLSASLPPGSPQQANVGRVLEAAQRASSITSQLLALGRRQMLRRVNFDLGTQAASTAELLRGLVGENIRVEIEIDRTMPFVRADRAQVEQVLLNLVVNARDAMPEGGTMRIAVRRANPLDAARCEAHIDPLAFAVVSVEDTGIGMDEQTRTRIFEPFYTTKREGRGTGLGLAVVYGAVKQGDGHVLVESEPGVGSRFTVLLPFAPATEGAGGSATDRDAAAAGPPSRPGLILVVEDEEVIRDVVQETLRRAGHQVVLAGNGEDAMARIRAGLVPDLVLTDVMMPRMGGLPLAAALREQRPGARVAFMSGYSEELLGVQAPQSRGEAFLPKPFSPEELLAFVAGQLNPAHPDPATPGRSGRS